MRINFSFLAVTSRNKRQCKQTAFCIAHALRKYQILVLQAIYKAHEQGLLSRRALDVIILLSSVRLSVHSNSARDAESPI